MDIHLLQKEQRFLQFLRNENIEKLSKEYAEMQEDPIKVAKEGYLDNVVEATNLRPYLASALMMLKGI